MGWHWYVEKQSALKSLLFIHIVVMQYSKDRPVVLKVEIRLVKCAKCKHKGFILDMIKVSIVLSILPNLPVYGI